MGFRNISVAQFNSPSDSGLSGIPVGRLVFDATNSKLYRKTAVNSADTITAGITAGNLVEINKYTLPAASASALGGVK